MRRFVPLALAVSFACALPMSQRPAVAQSDAKRPSRVRQLEDLNDWKVTMDLQDVTLKEALDRLFKKVPVNRVLMFDPNVGGTFSLKVENVPFEGALMCILRSVRKVPLRYQTAGDIMVISQDDPSRTSATHRVWADVENTSVREVIGTLLKTRGANYTLDASVQGRVTLTCAAERFDSALDKVCKTETAPVVFLRDDDGLYRFTTQK